MTQHESFPGRPRGRRARQDDGSPEYQGYDATPQDQREFPDLAPIRPREARARDGRVQGQPGQAADRPATWPDDRRRSDSVPLCAQGFHSALRAVTLR